ncbi:MAG: alpha/beta fold hydrolase [Candidatus Eremiobacteraeota bacterium]|nr:alpha/beta fold hydrolase [Candidatus Eremiobacteraeota bacterium]
MEEFMLPSDTTGIQLYVRNKHPRGQSGYTPEKIVLFVHGSTYPAETSFDLPLGGISWMEYIAERGYDVYLVDVRGYGRSTRPAEMEQPPSANPPIVRTDVAMRDVGSAVEFIKKRRNVSKIVLMGWSWGTTIMGAYTSSHNDNVAKLVLYAPLWLRQTASLINAGPGPLGAYRTVKMDVTKTRWLTGVPEDAQTTLIPPGWFDQWIAATWATDPNSSKTNPPVLRAPNGTVADTSDYWSAGKPYYDPSKIAVPTMIAHAEWDADAPFYMTQAYWQKLTSVPYKRWVEIGGGTHTIMMERNRMELFREVQLFLDDAYKPES